MQPEYHPMTIEIDGKPVTGYYTVKSGIVTVKMGHGQKSEQLGGFEPTLIAGWLLRELVTEERNKNP